MLDLAGERVGDLYRLAGRDLVAVDVADVIRALIPDGVVARHLAGVCPGRLAEDVRERDRLVGRRVVQEHAPPAPVRPLPPKQDPVPGNGRMPLPPARVDRRRSRLHVRDDVHQPDVGVAPAIQLIHERRAIDAACPGTTAGVHLEGRLAGTALDKQPHRAPTRPGEVRPSARSRRLLEGRSRLDGDLRCGLCRPCRGHENHRDHSRATDEVASRCTHGSPTKRDRTTSRDPLQASPYSPARTRVLFLCHRRLTPALSGKSLPDFRICARFARRGQGCGEDRQGVVSSAG